MRSIARAAGILCVMAACFFAGMQMERRLKRRWQLFREMWEALTFLEKEMTYHRSPIPEAFRSAAKRCTTGLGEVFSRAAAQVEQRSGRSFRTIWEDALDGCIPGDLLTREEAQLFAEVSAALCNTDVVMQKMLLGKYADRFRMLSEEEAQACREKGGLYRKLAAAAGVFLLILLL